MTRSQKYFLGLFLIVLAFITYEYGSAILEYIAIQIQMYYEQTR
jgi:hypothetical protein